MLFYGLSLLMILAALAIVLPCIIRPKLPKSTDDDLRKQQNIAAAREQLTALHTDGTPQKMSSPTMQDDYETEIQSRLLTEITEITKTESSHTQHQQSTHPPQHPNTFAVLLVMLVLFAGAPMFYYLAGTPEMINAKPQPQIPPTINIEAAIAGLQKHLQQNPEDDEALILMARALSTIGKYRQAAEHYTRARAIVGDDPALLAANIYALLLSENASAETDALLKSALAAHPNSGEIQLMAGLHAQTLDNNKQATHHLRRAISLLTDEEARQLAKQTLTEIETEIGTVLQ